MIAGVPSTLASLWPSLTRILLSVYLSHFFLFEAVLFGRTVLMHLGFCLTGPLYLHSFMSHFAAYMMSKMGRRLSVLMQG